MEKLLLNAFLITLKINANGATVYASDFEWNTDDATSALVQFK